MIGLSIAGHPGAGGACGYGYGYTLGPSPVPPIYLTGTFGLVRPAWI